jgi:hypothetical protein
VRGERAPLTRNTEWFERCLDCCGKLGEFRTGFDTSPEHARAALIWEKSKAAKIYEHGSAGGDGGKRRLDHFGFIHRSFADKFERDVKAFDARPARVSGRAMQFGDQGCEVSSDVFRNVDRNKETHESTVYPEVNFDFARRQYECVSKSSGLFHPPDLG